MKNIHVLPTEKPSKLRVHECGQLFLSINFIYEINDENKKHIYITSDEEIKDGDFAYDSTSKTIVKVDFIKDRGDGILIVGAHSINLDDNYTDLLSNFKKIILTTDQDLIKDGVQAIDDEFLEWFVKNPSWDSVEVQDMSMQYHDEGYYEYKIIIPKEDWLLNNPQCKQIESCSKSLSKKCICPKEEPKQETLEEASDRAYSCGLFSTKTAFIAGAKWQQKQDKKMYSEEEHTDILEVGQILVNEETLEYGLLQHIKICLECNNESQAIRLLEKYGFEKQEERYSEEEVLEILNKFSASCYSPIEKFEIPVWFKKIKNK
jgi:hypothetical protein